MDTEADPMRAYRAVNVAASLALGRQAHAGGVKRLVFVSSVKVNGEATTGRAYGADDVPGPADPYGHSKREAEAALLAFGRDSGLEIVIVRPPLVYGPGVKANFLNLIKLVRLGLPLPFGRIRNARSMVALDNLVDLLLLCCRHPAAPGRVFMVSDGADLSTAELARMIARAMGKRSLLVPVPVGLMGAAARLLGNPAQFLTPIGSFLRKSSLDEIPQLWCIVRGDMSLVGPRPALFNQQNLIEMRTAHGVHTVRPGLTGWAEINGRDELPLPEKVRLDLEYVQRQSIGFDLKVILLTVLKVLRRDGIVH